MGTIFLVLEKWFPLLGELAQSENVLCTYIRFQKQNRKEKEEETEQQQTYPFTTKVITLSNYVYTMSP